MKCSTVSNVENKCKVDLLPVDGPSVNFRGQEL